MGLFGQPVNPIIIHCDNQSSIKLSVNSIFHDRSKYIEIPYHYVRDMVEVMISEIINTCTKDIMRDDNH